MTMGNENGAPQKPLRMRIPEEYQSGFSKIIGLKDKPFQELLTAIKEERPALYYTDFSDRIVQKVSTIPPSDVRDIIVALVSLYGVHASLALEIPEFVDIVREAVERAPELELPVEERGRFEERLALFLGIDSIEATSKALDVMLEHEHTFHGVRIMSDVRPVFGEKVDKLPIGAIVIHSLKISYHDESEEVKEFYVALDTEDIGELSAEIERANQKAEWLKRMLDPTGVPYIDAG